MKMLRIRFCEMCDNYEKIDSTCCKLKLKHGHKQVYKFGEPPADCPLEDAPEPCEHDWVDAWWDSSSPDVIQCEKCKAKIIYRSEIPTGMGEADE